MTLRAAYVQEAVGEWRTTGAPTARGRGLASRVSPPPPHETPPAPEERKPAAAFTFRPLDPVTAVDAEPLAAPLDSGLLDILPEPGVDEASTDDDELDKPTLAMIAGEESDDEDWRPAFANGPAWIPPLSR
ncbi:hypothetical protein CYMTET_23557 [Cymbomonas tetramitiformis]|uniref:Uncharacterized protein n=1 Tax=Cymbomonas tetramitiformis TaxID=36881 RepID=A0AAE0FY93_9CHLO|nr:hypothetical protein CYMTET_23557 [Cymbomonas tetramitiformis]